MSGDLKTVGMVLRIIDRRIRLYGLDAKPSGELTLDQIDEEIARLQDKLGLTDAEAEALADRTD